MSIAEWAWAAVAVIYLLAALWHAWMFYFLGLALGRGERSSTISGVVRCLGYGLAFPCVYWKAADDQRRRG